MLLHFRRIFFSFVLYKYYFSWSLQNLTYYYYHLFTWRNRKVKRLIQSHRAINWRTWDPIPCLADFKDPYINLWSSYTSFLNSCAFVPLPRIHLVLPSPSCLFYPSDLTCSGALFNVTFYTVISQFLILLDFLLDSKLCDSRDQICLVQNGLFKTMTHTC